ncbi:MAG TPA: polysaccharide biosynthesis/export family protein [Candidatus Acidoferrales bacterium]|nr:polysaccharide biosynthesis/export family protein [Candidatus Acidoferrales bacterium]
MSKPTRRLVSLALGLMISPAWGQKTEYQPGPWDSVPQEKDASAQKAATQDPNYVIGSQDVLDISVWKEAELTRTVPVRPDGKISLPLLNDVQAAGLTPMQLANEITTGLKKFVTDPEVTVIVAQINSQRVYIMGEAARPGAYPLLPNMTFLQALSSAGGFTQFAKLRKIYMFRMENGKQVKYPFDYKDVISGKRPEQNIVLKAGDTIVVP